MILGAIRRLGGRAGFPLLAEELLTVHLVPRSLVGRGHECRGDLANLLDRGVRRRHGLTAAQCLRGRAQGGDRSVDATRDP